MPYICYPSHELWRNSWRGVAELAARGELDIYSWCRAAVGRAAAGRRVAAWSRVAPWSRVADWSGVAAGSHADILLWGLSCRVQLREFRAEISRIAGHGNLP